MNHIPPPIVDGLFPLTREFLNEHSALPFYTVWNRILKWILKRYFGIPFSLSLDQSSSLLTTLHKIKCQGFLFPEISILVWINKPYPPNTSKKQTINIKISDRKKYLQKVFGQPILYNPISKKGLNMYLPIVYLNLFQLTCVSRNADFSRNQNACYQGNRFMPVKKHET